MRRIFITLVIILRATVAFAEHHLPYRWSREIQIPELRENQLISVPLDEHFFEHTREGYPDVRLRDEQGAAVGYLIHTIRELKPRTVRKTWIAKQTAAKVDSATGMQIDLQLRDKEDAPDGLRIVTPLRDFEHQVKIETSADGMTWTSTGSPSVVFDYSQYVDARNDLVEIPRTQDRHFRVIIEDVTADQMSQLVELNRRLSGEEISEKTERSTVNRRPFRVDKIEFYRDEPASAATGEPRQISYPVGEFSLKSSKDHPIPVYFKTQHVPISSVKVLVTDKNFSRIAQIEAAQLGANGTGSWQEIAQGTLVRFDVGTLQRESLTLNLPETRAAEYRVRIGNLDSAPLEITGVEVWGPAYELTFIASPGQRLILDYGSPMAKGGQYDVAAVDAALRQPQEPLMAQLDPPYENANAPMRDVSKPWNDSRLLGAVVVVLTIILGWGLFRASHRLNETTEQ